MADLIFSATTSDVALVSATAKTVLQIQAPTSRRVKVLGWSVFFDGQVVTNEPVTVSLIRQTTAGTMTAYTSSELMKVNHVEETVQSTVRHSATVEPTSFAGLPTIDTALVHPQSGYEVKFPIGQEPIVNGEGFVGLVCTAPSSVNVRAKILCEE